MVAREAAPAPLTYAQLVRLREKLDERSRYEIIAGELYVSPSPSIAHQWVVSQFHRVLSSHVWEQGIGMVFVAPLDVILTDNDVVEPDVLYVTADQIERAACRGVEEPPTLVIEVLSPSTAARDRTAKFELYERQGVPHYWMAHPTRRSLQIYELRGGRHELMATLTGNAEFRPALFPGLVIRLAEIWPPRALTRGR